MECPILAKFRLIKKSTSRKQIILYTVNMHQSLNELLTHSCTKFSEQIAFTNMGHNLSYRDLEHKSRIFAAFLQQQLQCKPGDRLAIMLPNTLQYPIAMFGALRAGLIVVNVNPLYTSHELQQQLQDSGATTIVVLANFANTVAQILTKTKIKNIIITELGDLLAFPKSIIINNIVKYIKKLVPKISIKQYYKFNAVLKNQDNYTELQITKDNLAFLQYTGGTTGIAKGAMLTHGNILANIEQITHALKNIIVVGNEIIITALPLYHIFSLTINCLSFVQLGAKNILITNPKDLNSFVKVLVKNKFTAITGVNTLFNALLKHENFKKIDFSAMHLAIGGGMALQKETMDQWQQQTHCPLLEGYGLTECSPVICINPLNATRGIGVGKPVMNTKIRLQDGELLVQGPQVMQSYWHNQEQTDLVIDSDGWLHTGDIATIDANGFVHIVDRKKDLIIVSGFNVYPSEIEQLLL
ncbi:MAG: long-chain-fatty-acid--CoA ligase, partial [Legionellales bacterium]